MRRVFHLACALLSALGALLSGLAYHDRYWRWRDCFNELGRCYDSASEQVFLQQAGVVWGSLAVICLLVSALFIWRASR